MATLKTKTDETSVEEKLNSLFELQQAVSKIDSIRTLRGELPLEVQDLEDEIEGLETRIVNLETEIKSIGDNIISKKNQIAESELLIKKYEAQQSNVKNNREFDSLNKEIEYQTLEIEHCNKIIKEFGEEEKSKKSLISESKKFLEERKIDLKEKKKELNDIIFETQTEEEKLIAKSEKIEKKIDDRLLAAFHRIRKNAVNGLAVVTVQRNACGGCFNKIPPQRQLDIQSQKKVIVCEYCGRILVQSMGEE